MIGEAAAHISEGFREAYPQIPWHQIIGTRHRIVHDYMDIDLDLVWSIVTGDLPDLLVQIKAILPPGME